MMQKRTFFFLAILAVCLASLPGNQLSQTLPTDPNMVYVPVAVTGAKNAYVGNLQKENFQLREDGKEQTIAYFSPSDQPYDINIVLAMAALQRGKADLNSSKIREAVEEFQKAGNPNNRYNVEEMPFGSNGVFDAISRHVRNLTTLPNPRKAVIVLTDGFDSGGGDPGRALQEYAKKEDVPVYIFFTEGNTRGPSDDILEVARGQGIHLEGGTIYEDLTRFTGGRLYQAEADTQLRAHLQVLAQELRNQYVLGFKSTNPERNDKWRKLEVKMNPPVGQRDLKSKVRDRYFVAKKVG